MEKIVLNNTGKYNPYELKWNSTIVFPSTRKLKQYGNRIYNRYPARSIFLVPRNTILNFKRNRKLVNILDPFMGSGTTAVESILQNCNIYGTEMDPFARLVSEASVQLYSDAEFIELEDIFSKINSNWKNQKPLSKYTPKLKNIEYWFDKEVFTDLLSLKSYIFEFVKNDKFLIFFKVVFADCIKPSSKMERQSIKPYISSKYPKTIKPVNESFQYSYKAHIETLKDYKDKTLKQRNIEWLSFDATNFELANKSIDIAISSPPYLSAFDYTHVIKIESAWLGLLQDPDILKLRCSQVGHQKRRDNIVCTDIVDIFSDYYYSILNGDKKNSKISNINVAKGAQSYFNDMYKNLYYTYNVLKEKGQYHLIIGDNVINGINIPTHKIVAQIAEKIGFNWFGYYKYPIKDHRTSIPRNANGKKIKYEYVLMLEK